MVINNNDAVPHALLAKVIFTMQYQENGVLQNVKQDGGYPVIPQLIAPHSSVEINVFSYNDFSQNTLGFDVLALKEMTFGVKLSDEGDDRVVPLSILETTFQSNACDYAAKQS